MGGRRRNLFVLLFVGGLIAVSAWVIASKQTKLGLDLKGGIQLVLQGRPTPQQPTIDNASMTRAVDTIRNGCDQLGVSEIEVARVGADQIQVGIPGATSVGKATDCATKPARLFFYDWEPNLIGIEHQVAGTPGTTNQAALARLSKQWQAAGRNPTGTINQQLVGSGALPTEWDAAQFAAQQKPVKNCSNCSQRATFFFFSKDKSHRLIDGPETVRSDLFVSPNGRKRPQNSGSVVRVPEGTLVVNQHTSDSSGLTLPNATPGWYAIKDNPAVAGTQITSPKQGYDSQTNQPNVTFGLSGDGQSKFRDVTRRIAERGLANAIPGQSSGALSGSFAIVLDNVVESRPIVDFNQNPQGIDPSRGGVQITGLQLGEAQTLTDFLKRGALPIDLKVISQSQVSATLGKQALDEGLRAGVAGVIIVVLFLLLFYRFLGLVASIALGAYGVIFFALIKLIPVTLTLPGIAGLVLTIGVAADSNIVIFERIKEEVRSGRSMPASIAAGYRRGIATIVDANVVTILTAFILFVLATAGVKGFALILALGTITSLLTAVVFTQALLGTMSHSRLLRSPAALGAGGKQRVRWHFDFMGASRWFFSMSGTILIVGSIALATKQLNLGIDFKSGTRVEVSLLHATDENGVRDALSGAGISGAEVQRVSNPGLGDNAFLIQSKTLQPARIKTLQRTLEKDFGIRTNGFDSTSVGPTFGTTVANSARNALIFSLLVICAYVALRFQPKFALPVLIALFHDILITAGVYSLTGREVTSGTVAAFLTILGFSLYDTIIVFDRIRENLPRMPRAAFSQIVNRSMSEVLTRSLATSFSTLLPVLALLLFGGTTLKDFAFALLVGIASGAYSSIFIASPVLTAWKEREPDFRARRDRIEAAMGTVPPFAEEAPVAKLDEVEEEAEPEKAPEAALTPASQAAGRRSQAEILAEAGLSGEKDGAGDGASDEVSEDQVVGASNDGEGSTERRPQGDKRRRQRGRRRKHGRRR
ncbi:MAG TPA: protein translocase subunit SecD [Solirubrobacterales bacterium]